jgi:hypothetical protein
MFFTPLFRTEALIVWTVRVKPTLVSPGAKVGTVSETEMPL